ncbi:MAG: class I mannose-6-phosphate isomerase, partial [Pseudomonadales bacterium]|nr:class I mannose-6-phosphate isomerase [Pseudomonadales bacterium]
PGAEIILGVRPGTTPAAVRAALQAGQLEPYQHRLPVQTGDHVCVPAGSLHAIMGGLLIAEIQQNSNTTYRVYDWNRLGSDGRPRPLHVDRALDVINFAQTAPTLHPPQPLAAPAGVQRWELCRNRYFVTERVVLAEGAAYQGNLDGETLEIWGLLSGRATINQVPLNAVQFALLPAALGPFTLTAATPATLLRTFVAPLTP